MCFMAISMTSLEKCASRSLGNFLLFEQVFLLLLLILSWTSDLYVFVLGAQELSSVILIHNIYSHLDSFFI